MYEPIKAITSLEQLDKCLAACCAVASSEIMSGRGFYQVQGRYFKYPNGTRQWREWVDKRPATVVVPEDPDGNFVMVIQPTGVPEDVKAMVQFPSGYAERGEDAKTTGIREMLEETGLSASSENITDLGAHHQDPGLIAKPVHVYLAEYCVQHYRPKLDQGEYIQLYKVSKSMFMQMLLGGYIKDANTYIASIKALFHLDRLTY